MVNQLYNTINSYFSHLFNTGYMSQKEVNKVLLFSLIEELVNNDFRGLITQEDYTHINKALYCLYGSSCLVPYPDYYNPKNKRVMYNGSISELSYRVQRLEDQEVIIPGEEVEETEDIDIE